jgi:hypothetical protein
LSCLVISTAQPAGQLYAEINSRASITLISDQRLQQGALVISKPLTITSKAGRGEPWPVINCYGATSAILVR